MFNSSRLRQFGQVWQYDYFVLENVSCFKFFHAGEYLGREGLQLLVLDVKCPEVGEYSEF